jgi:hypothetical protein
MCAEMVAEDLKAAQRHAFLKAHGLAPGSAGRQPGRLKGLIDTSAFFDPLPDEELNAWEGR